MIFYYPNLVVLKFPEALQDLQCELLVFLQKTLWLLILNYVGYTRTTNSKPPCLKKDFTFISVSINTGPTEAKFGL